PQQAYEADSVQLAAIGIPDEERREWVATGGAEVRVAASARFREAEANAAGDALAAEPVVVRQLVHAAGLESVSAANERGSVVEGVDGVLGAVVGVAAPTAIAGGGVNRE